MREPLSETGSRLFDARGSRTLATPGTVSRVRIPPARSILVIFVALLAVVWATGGATSAQEPELGAPAITEFGPTAMAPSGGRPEGRGSGSGRWRYRGTLGVLENNEQVVPPITDPPVDDPARAPLTGTHTRIGLLLRLQHLPPSQRRLKQQPSSLVKRRNRGSLRRLSGMRRDCTHLPILVC